ncbi:MAG: hypothetical protein ACTSPB_24495, partial [Candidatus Thorarchaeota archaeon]
LRWKDGYFAGALSSGSLDVGSVGNLGSLQIGGTEVIDASRILKNITSIAQNLLPDTDNSRDLGSSSYRWRNGFIQNLALNQGTLWFKTNTDQFWKFYFTRTDVEDGIEYIRLVGRNLEVYSKHDDVSVRFRLQSGQIFPSVDNVIDLGSSSYRWKDGYFAGNLGVGALTPKAKLHVLSTDIVSTVSNYVTVLIERGEAALQIAGTDSGSHAADIILSAGESKHWVITHRGPERNDRFTIGYMTDISPANLDNATELLNITTDGNVGIGIGATNPLFKLEVAGGVGPHSDNVYDLGSSSLRWKDGWFGNNVYIGSAVGVGTTSPVKTLDLRGEMIAIASRPRIYLGSTSTGNSIGFEYYEGTDALKIQKWSGYGGTWVGDLAILTLDGKLGLGHSGGEIPSEKLHVKGNIRGFNLFPDADNTYDLGSSSLGWRNLYLNNLVVGGLTVINSNRNLSNFVFDLRYNAGTFTLYNFQPNNLYLAHLRGYTITWNDTTGLSYTNNIWYTDLSEKFMRIDLSQSADPLILTVEGTLAVSTNVGQNRLVVVWHGSKGYNDIKFEVKRNDDVWVEVPLDFEFSVGGSTYQVSKPINPYAPYPTYTPWEGFRITFSNKVSTSGIKSLYGVIYYVPRDPYPYFIRKSGDTIFGTLTAQQIIPRTDNTYDLGSSSIRWKNGYFAGLLDIGSLKVGGTEVITSGRVLQNVTGDASIITSGVFDLDRI